VCLARMLCAVSKIATNVYDAMTTFATNEFIIVLIPKHAAPPPPPPQRGVNLCRREGNVRLYGGTEA
jgi:hypothetical protein